MKWSPLSTLLLDGVCVHLPRAFLTGRPNRLCAVNAAGRDPLVSRIRVNVIAHSYECSVSTLSFAVITCGQPSRAEW
jgi:hypothetical protein